jgi:hypothetical protein
MVRLAVFLSQHAEIRRFPWIEKVSGPIRIRRVGRSRAAAPLPERNGARCRKPMPGGLRISG